MEGSQEKFGEEGTGGGGGEGSSSGPGLGELLAKERSARLFAKGKSTIFRKGTMLRFLLLYQ